MNVDYFAHRAQTFDQDKTHIQNIGDVANYILKEIKFDPSMHVMDFGSGTGLLLERIAPFVGKITGVDISRSMNRQLEEKRCRLPCALDIQEVDLEKSSISIQVEGIVSSMTMHHIENIDAMFKKFHSMLKSGGFIAISDLDSEDGSFHTEDMGVFHHGFDRNEFSKSASRAGFQSVKISSACVVHVPHGDYDVFLLTAIRP